MLEKLYAFREKYVNEVIAIDKEIEELQTRRLLSVAKVQVVDDMLAENTPTEPTQPLTDESY